MHERMIESMAKIRRKQAQEFLFSDTNLWLGQMESRLLPSALSLAELNKAVGCRYITGGVVWHWRGKTVSPQEGNLALLDVEEKLPLDYSLGMTAYPLSLPADGPLPGSCDMPESVRAIRLFPKSHGYMLTDWCLAELCRWLVTKNLPLFVWHTEVDWVQLHALAGIYPSLRIVVDSQPRKIIYHLQSLWALLRDRSNVFLEISNVPVSFVEFVSRSLGPERLLFGSFFPANDPFVAIGKILDSNMDESDKRQIAGVNLRKILSEVSH
jgi:hypothetical protein